MACGAPTLTLTQTPTTTPSTTPTPARTLTLTLTLTRCAPDMYAMQYLYAPMRWTACKAAMRLCCGQDID